MSTRRGFLKNLITAAAGFAILPSATTYARKWLMPKPGGLILPNPEWVTAQYEIAFVFHPSALKEFNWPTSLEGYKLQPRENKTPIIERVEMNDLSKSASSFRTPEFGKMITPSRFKRGTDRYGRDVYVFVPPYISGTVQVV